MMNCVLPFHSLRVKASGLQHPEPTMIGSTQGTQVLGFPPSRQQWHHGQAPPLRRAGAGARRGASLGVSRETLQQMACLAELQWHICSAAGGKAIFGKSLLSQVQLVLIPPSPPSPPPFNQRFYFSPTSFISGNEVSIFTAGTLSEGSQSTNQCLTLQEPRFLWVFLLLLISPLSLPVTLCRLSRWPVEYKGKCC